MFDPWDIFRGFSFPIKRIKIVAHRAIANLEVDFGPEFNVVVGPNGSGKTSLLEAAALPFPHRQNRTVVARDAGTVSHAELTALIPIGALRAAFEGFSVVNLPPPSDRPAAVAAINATLRQDEATYLPFAMRVPPTSASPPDANITPAEAARRTVMADIAQKLRTSELPLDTQGRVLATIDQSPGQSEQPVQEFRNVFNWYEKTPNDPTGQYWKVRFNPSTREVQELPDGSGNYSTVDFLQQLASQVLGRRYYFGPQRNILDHCSLQAEPRRLLPNLSNLAICLAELRANPDGWTKYGRSVRACFPRVQNIELKPDGSEIAIIVWDVDPVGKRTDHAPRLSDCGSGLAQVMALLFVAQTLEYSGIIAIDEPQSFLHPSAYRALLEELGRYKHQYIISTHSHIALQATAATVLNLDVDAIGNTVCQVVNALDVNALRNIMDNLGVTVSDIFGATAVIWVEGETEAMVFGEIFGACLGRRDVLALPIGHTGSFDRKLKKQLRDIYLKELFGIYCKIGTAKTILPPYIGFVLDREDRTADEVQRIISSGPKGKVVILSKRMFENYILHRESIRDVLRDLLGNTYDDQRFSSSWNKIVTSGEDSFPDSIDGAAFLGELFEAVSGQTPIYYDKKRHGKMLVKRILETAPEVLRPLVSEVQPLIS